MWVGCDMNVRASVRIGPGIVAENSIVCLTAGTIAENPLHVGQEPEVEHLVGLVQDEGLDPAEHEVAAVGQVEQPAGSADDEVDSGVQRGDLRLVGPTAVDGGHRQPEELADVVQVAGHLHAKLRVGP